MIQFLYRIVRFESSKCIFFHILKTNLSFQWTMKSQLVVIVSVGILLFSCSSSNEEYSFAATELCRCMEENGDKGENDPLVKVHLGVCLLDARIDLKDPEMLEAVKVECPEVKGAFSDYVKRMSPN